MKKSKKHKKIVNDFDKTKEKHLERLATKMLKKDEVNNKKKFDYIVILKNKILMNLKK